MQLASIRIITADVDRLTTFYEGLLGTPAARLAPVFSEFRAATGTLAISAPETAGPAAAGTVEPASNRSVIVEFQVDDVDEVFASRRDRLGTVVQEPTTMPWGNRSLLLLDPDGNLVNLFAPAGGR